MRTGAPVSVRDLPPLMSTPPPDVPWPPSSSTVPPLPVEDPPPAWEMKLRALTRVDRVVGLARVPTDRRHNAKVDRVRLAAMLDSKG